MSCRSHSAAARMLNGMTSNFSIWGIIRHLFIIRGLCSPCAFLTTSSSPIRNARRPPETTTTNSGGRPTPRSRTWFQYVIPVMLVKHWHLLNLIWLQDRYKELLCVSRQWRNLQMRRNASFGHRHDDIGPGDLAVRCPACPQPDVNLPDGWQDDQQR